MSAKVDTGRTGAATPPGVFSSGQLGSLNTFFVTDDAVECVGLDPEVRLPPDNLTGSKPGRMPVVGIRI
jgi:hypothetical protein